MEDSGRYGLLLDDVENRLNEAVGSIAAYLQEHGAGDQG
jgi:hypothetical protein